MTRRGWSSGRAVDMGAPILSGKQRLLWVSDGPAPGNVRDAVDGRWELVPYRRDAPVDSQLRAVSLALMYPNGTDDVARFGEILARLSGSPAVGVLLVPQTQRDAWQSVWRRGGQFICASQAAPSAELAATLAAAAALQPTIHNLRNQVSRAHSACPPDDAGALQELREEMRLAARLQLDFLPRRLPEVGPVRFSVLFRPASWVSGDIYDVTRLDETHVGFYVVDAMGHGLPAALLTMFVKKALQTKRIVGNTYEIVPPQVSLAQLNADICEHEFSSCQFCTAVYGVLDTADLNLTFARAGHPEVLRIRPDGSVERLGSQGSLLGVLPENHIEARHIRLDRGDRLVAYTDGAEEILCLGPDGQRRPLEDVVAAWAGIPRDRVLEDLAARVDAVVPGSRYDDDVTLIIADISP